jgi:beta-lactamase regulating signal transducer with metallopeptidase domain
MNPLLHAVSTLSAAMACSLVSAIWEGTILALCVAFCLHFLPDLSATARWVVWTNVFLQLLLLHFFPSMDRHFQSGRGFQATSFHLDPLWSVAIASIWLMLSIWRCVQLISSAVYLRGVAMRATRIQPEDSIQILLQTGKNRRVAVICTSTEVERPCVVGFLHPRILLPMALLHQLSATDLEQVVLHEMGHLHRADDWFNLLQKISVMLFPLNPVLFWVERRLCAEREFACDDRVLLSHCDKKSYALCLTRLAEITLVRRGLSLALGAWERRPELARRVLRILRRSDETMRRGPAACLAGCLLLAVLVGAISLARTPQVVSFALPVPSTMRASSSSASVLPPMSHPEFSAHPTRVKAEMPQRISPKATRLNDRRGSSLTQALQQSQPTPDQPELIVLTEWEGDGSAARLMIAVAEDHHPSYAAVAVANGWLIVQI